MHDTLRRLHGGRRGTGTTIDRFRLNELVSQVAFGGRRGAVYRRMVALAGVRPGAAVLDVGCSSGYLARKLAAAAGPDGHVTGVDPSEPAIAYARRRALPAMTFTVAVAQDLPLPDESFDVVTATLALHHVPARKREAALREMFRVTRPGGRLLAADFDPSRQPFPLHPGGRRMRRVTAAVGALEDLAAAAGYRVESSGRLPLLRYVVAVRP
jgi:ubiquinone/menaquinone biosynthesis C-methylase UbiE